MEFPWTQQAIQPIVSLVWQMILCVLSGLPGVVWGSDLILLDVRALLSLHMSLLQFQSLLVEERFTGLSQLSQVFLTNATIIVILQASTKKKF